MALKTEKYRKYYLKCSNTFFADCKQTLTAILRLYSQLLHSLLIGTVGYVHASLFVAPWFNTVPKNHRISIMNLRNLSTVKLYYSIQSLIYIRYIMHPTIHIYKSLVLWHLSSAKKSLEIFPVNNTLSQM